MDKRKDLNGVIPNNGVYDQLVHPYSHETYVVTYDFGDVNYPGQSYAYAGDIFVSSLEPRQKPVEWYNNYHSFDDDVIFSLLVKHAKMNTDRLSVSLKRTPNIIEGDTS